MCVGRMTRARFGIQDKNCLKSREMNMDQNDIQKAIESGKTVLGIELGSTRIKAVLIGEDHTPLASGSHEWENQHENGVWTYSLEAVWAGLQESYRNLSKDVSEKYNVQLKNIGAIGFSAMMHGYMASVSYTHLRAHETPEHLVCRLLLEKKKK